MGYADRASACFLLFVCFSCSFVCCVAECNCSQDLGYATSEVCDWENGRCYCDSSKRVAGKSCDECTVSVEHECCIVKTLVLSFMSSERISFSESMKRLVLQRSLCSSRSFTFHLFLLLLLPDDHLRLLPEHDISCQRSCRRVQTVLL